jgi:hypothetical protein
MMRNGLSSVRGLTMMLRFSDFVIINLFAGGAGAIPPPIVADGALGIVARATCAAPDCLLLDSALLEVCAAASAQRANATNTTLAHI